MQPTSRPPSSFPSNDRNASSAFRTWAELSSRALLNNIRVISRQVPGCGVLPMIKANAYGHGMSWAAREILGANLPELHGFGVATLEEGVELRNAIGSFGESTPILVCSGAAPWTEEKGRICQSHGLTPVLATLEDWRAFLQGGWAGRIPYEVKFNTGMNRLGLHLDELQDFKKDLKNLAQAAHPKGVLSHLAVAETPAHRVTRKQLEKFSYIRKELQGLLPGTRFHLGNSAGIWNQKQYRLSEITDLVRPGISLYGIPPWPKAPVRGLQPVMNVYARVISLHTLKAGECIGYGATFKVPGKGKPVRAAILAAGYGDGLHRAMSNCGSVLIGGRKTPFIGIVSMDLSAVKAPLKAKIGDAARVLGEGIDPWEQAKAAQTIPYELFTSLTSRVQRVYG